MKKLRNLIFILRSHIFILLEQGTYILFRVFTQNRRKETWYIKPLELEAVRLLKK